MTTDNCPLSRDELIEMLADLHGFVLFALDNKLPAGMICATIGHDIGGTLAGERYFMPRTHGNAKFLRGAK